MALVFNGFSFLASVVALFSGEPVLITVVIAVASLFVTVVGTIAYQRKGQL
jgi:low affinity Fe/Cu permease